MDGKDLYRRLAHILDEDTDSPWLDERSSYDHLYEAAKEWVDRTGCLTSTQTITTSTSGQSFDLNPDFLRLAVKDSDEDYIIRVSDGSTFQNIKFKRYDDIFVANKDDNVAWPTGFSIHDNTNASRVTGTANTAGDATGGKSLLSTTEDLTDVGPGDIVHNITDGSDGVVISTPSDNSAYTALFGGTDNEWDSSDSFIIQPGARYKLTLMEPIEDAKTITVPYIQVPDPVYTDYDVYRFPSQYTTALVKYAFWAYKYRDKEPNIGDAMYQYWDQQVRKYLYSVNANLRTNEVRVSFKR